jgi:Trypsin-like peptidase domain
MSTNMLRLCLCAALLVACLSVSYAEQNTAAQGRAILEKNKLTVVTIKLVTTMTGMGRDQDNSQEVTGTVIDPTGLTVLSLTAVDPTSIISAMSGMMGDMPEISSEVKSAEILLDDGNGTELPAEIVLRDKHLDLAFLRPKEKPAEPMTCVDINDLGTAEILDEVVALNRLGKVARRTYSASIERVEAIVEKPRKFYMPGASPTNTGMGSPVFTLDGKFLGIPVMRAVKTDGGGFSLFGGSQPFAVVIIPAEDVREAAEQVPPFGEAPAEEKKEE